MLPDSEDRLGLLELSDKGLRQREETVFQAILNHNAQVLQQQQQQRQRQQQQQQHPQQHPQQQQEDGCAAVCCLGLRFVLRAEWLVIFGSIVVCGLKHGGAPLEAAPAMSASARRHALLLLLLLLSLNTALGAPVLHLLQHGQRPPPGAAPAAPAAGYLHVGRLPGCTQTSSNKPSSSSNSSSSRSSIGCVRYSRCTAAASAASAAAASSTPTSSSSSAAADAPTSAADPPPPPSAPAAAAASSGAAALPPHLRVFYQRNLHMSPPSHPIALIHRKILEYFVGAPPLELVGPPLWIPPLLRANTTQEGPPLHQQEDSLLAPPTEGPPPSAPAPPAAAGAIAATAAASTAPATTGDTPRAPDCIWGRPLRGGPLSVGPPSLALWHSLSPVVSISSNFDDLHIPPSHPARSPQQTFYLHACSKSRQRHSCFCLRTHTSAHIPSCLTWAIRHWGAPSLVGGPPLPPPLKGGRHHTGGGRGGNAPLTLMISGEVYRKDTIDSRHFPVFHQADVLRVLPPGVDPQEDLINVVEGLLGFVLPGVTIRIKEDFFPFTKPSIQAEARAVMEDGELVEVLGGGILLPEIVSASFDAAAAAAAGGTTTAGAAAAAAAAGTAAGAAAAAAAAGRGGSASRALKTTTAAEAATAAAAAAAAAGGCGVWAAYESELLNITEDTRGPLGAPSVEVTDRFIHPKRASPSLTLRLTYQANPDITDPAVLQRLSVLHTELLAAAVTQQLPASLRSK
ncbi:hypothetical protein ACSSS7_006832 [Eimeria intestinalis]